MSDLLIRGIPDEINAKLVSEAAANRRSREKQALRLIEQGLRAPVFESAGEIAEAVWTTPAPRVRVEAVDSYLAGRGRRSRRP